MRVSVLRHAPHLYDCFHCRLHGSIPHLLHDVEEGERRLCGDGVELVGAHRLVEARQLERLVREALD